MNVRLVEPADLRLAMRGVPAAVAVVTSQHGEQRNGVTVTAASSVSTEPPQMLVCINANASVHELISSSGAFTINYLDATHEQIAKLFSTSKLSAAERFVSNQWRVLPSGGLALARAVSAIDCRVVQEARWGTHTVFIGTVVGTLISTEDTTDPLLYHAGEFSRLARMPAADRAQVSA